MNNDNENDDVKFMLQRCLGLCLTDRKGGVAGGQVIEFDITDNTKAYSVSFYEPLALLCHAQRLTDSFSRDALFQIRHLMSIYGTQDTMKTQPSFRRTESDYKTALRAGIYSHTRRRLPEADVLICTMVGEEFLQHCESLLACFQHDCRKIENPSLLALLDWCHSRTCQLRISWDLLVREFQLPKARVLNLIGKFPNQGLIKIDEAESLNKRNPDTERIYQEYWRKVRFAKRLLVWRERWKNTTSGFGPGAKLKFEQTRSAPALFEIWCFMELANEMFATKQAGLVQSSLLRGANDNPLFRGSGNIDVYFDFHGNPHFLPSNERVLNRIHVEWFLRNRSDYAKSVILDTKYKASESINHLTTLGYMSAFQVHRGVVIFREELDVLSYHAVEADSRFALCRFGANHEQLLCALHMVPRQSDVHDNSRVLRKLIKKVILA